MRQNGDRRRNLLNIDRKSETDRRHEKCGTDRRRKAVVIRQGTGDVRLGAEEVREETRDIQET